MEHPDLSVLPDIPVPDGYILRNYQNGDEEGLCRVFAASDLGMETPERVREKLLNHPCFVPGRLFVVEKDDEIVGTASAWANAQDPSKGYLHMVGVLGGHRGKRLGALLTIAAMKYHRDLGFTAQQLDTDDWREAAVKLYLDLGYVPVYLDDSHPGRWEVLAAKLNRPQALEKALNRLQTPST
jgi:mycothiol synthase